ncbi:Flp pilus assembly protein CpaB [Ammonifex thiophilus]|uniref:Flp pilus assembly protein CpaB n=1 Tax=Ammonifex thiophilus TaxID=444093 RepID=A0A3D8P4L9_9THEO|nr:Flp pilus assembly protein CpaB [Ammonifex thiophilus]RDV84063.1 Flp pilus assembly protein CpaB [Ammonifex thiophilus]
MRAKLFLVLSFLCAVGAAVGTYFYLEHLKATYRQKAHYVPVVVAAQDIPARTLLTSSLLKLQDLPSSCVHPLALRRVEDAVGRVTTVPLVRGEVLLQSKLASSKDEKQELALSLQPGERAITLAVNAVSGVGGALKPGDRVDVVATFDLESQGTKTTYTVLVAGNVRVLALGSGGEKKPYDTVTLAVTPRQGALITLATERGSVRLFLRGPKEQEATQLLPVKLPDLLEAGKP